MALPSEISETNFNEVYDISDTTGFVMDPSLSSYELPTGFEEFKIVQNALTEKDGDTYRSIVDGLKIANKPQSFYGELAMSLNYIDTCRMYSLFTFINQKYIKCKGIGSDQINHVPYQTGIIWTTCAKLLGLPPVTTYGAVILYNCKHVKTYDHNIDDDSDIGPHDINNIDSMYAISDTSSELHFYKVHMAIEIAGAKILKQIYYIDQISHDQDKLLKLLNDLNKMLIVVTQNMLKMYHGCDPEVFWNYVRVYLGGYTEDKGLPNGITVDDTDIEPIKMGGGSGAQSTLIQAIDVVFGVSHGSDHGKDFLENQRKYMPQKHRNYLEALDEIYKDMKLRYLVDLFDDESLKKAHDNVVDSLKKFRLAHFKMVHNYVIKFAVPSTQNESTEDMMTKSQDGVKGSGDLPTDQLKEFVIDTDVIKTVNDDARIERRKKYVRNNVPKDYEMDSLVHYFCRLTHILGNVDAFAECECGNIEWLGWRGCVAITAAAAVAGMLSYYLM
jgi:hypothetical protein